MLTDENVADLLDAWVERGWATPLDRAFVDFLKEQQPTVPAPVLLAAALASYQLSRGHICLDLQAVLDDPDGTLAWPPEEEKEAPSTPCPPPSTALTVRRFKIPGCRGLCQKGKNSRGNETSSEDRQPGKSGFSTTSMSESRR